MATERDWVRVVREQRCEECGLDAASLPRSELPDGIAGAAASWSSLLQHSPVEQLRARPDGVAWSALEYGGHVLGVLEVFRGRVDRMLVEDDPDLGWWDHEAAVTDEAYQQMEPRALGDAIVASADALGGRVRGLADAQWSRAGVRRAGEQFTVEGLVRFALHELVHHLHDAGELVAAALSASLRPADEPGGLRAAPTVPADVSAFSSNTLFGQPGIYPDGPPMTPAAGQPLDDDGARAVLVDLLDAPHAAQALDRFEDRELRRPRARRAGPRGAPAARRWARSTRAGRVPGGHDPRAPTRTRADGWARPRRRRRTGRRRPRAPRGERAVRRGAPGGRRAVARPCPVPPRRPGLERRGGDAARPARGGPHVVAVGVARRWGSCAPSWHAARRR